MSRGEEDFDGCRIEDDCVDRRRERPLDAVISARLSRRETLIGLGASTGFGLFATVAPGQPRSDPGLGFQEVAHELSEGHKVAPGYSAQVIVRWGDPVARDSSPFDPRRPSAAAQLKQFGYNNDFLAFMPLPAGSQSSSHGLLCSNHEYPNTELMFSATSAADAMQLTKEQVEIEMAAVGHAVVEIRRDGNAWRVVSDSVFNRRLTALAQEFRIAGPAAGHARMKTSADPSGTRVIGTLHNCAGGKTPWGTVLSGEENIHEYFAGNPSRSPEAAAYRRYDIGGRARRGWSRFHDRFDLEKEPNEPNRFGWVVEIDPYDPTSIPVKRTALGRCKHEGAATAVSHDGRVALYTGDDARFEYVYKFVTRGRFDPTDRAANMDLLDDGTLYAARFEENGRMTWLPLMHGKGPLTAANGFASQADVVIEARRAADLVGATPMDRPEDIEPSPLTGSVYVVLTDNDQRKPVSDPDPRQRVNPANHRVNNRCGHIIEIVPPRVDGKADHAATECTWEFFLVAGDPRRPEHGARYSGPISENGWIARPDNVAFDPRGRIWIATDGQDDVAGISDSLYAAETGGDGRGRTRLFFNGPRGAEICGPEFTPDGRTLFVAIQHPAEERGSTYDKPSTRWPDFKPDMPPRPAVIAISKDDGGEIGS